MIGLVYNILGVLNLNSTKCVGTSPFSTKQTKTFMLFFFNGLFFYVKNYIVIIIFQEDEKYLTKKKKNMKSIYIYL